jgi:hypothetical protein
MNIPIELRRIEMSRKARELALQSTEWLSFSDIAEHSVECSRISETSPDHWLANKQIFAITLDKADYFPAYGLHEVMHGNVFVREPKPIMASLITTLGDVCSGWQLAAWFASASGYLNGARPMDLLDSEPERVMKAAKFSAEGVQHG